MQQPTQASRLLAQRYSLFAALISAASLLMFAPSLNFSFIADDAIYLGLNNRQLTDLPVSGLWRLLMERMNPWEFLPLRDFSYWLDIALWGDYAESFHRGNLLWWAICLAAVAWVFHHYVQIDSNNASVTQAGKPPMFAVLAGLTLFAFHQAHVEPVAWIAGRKDLLSTLFLVLAWGHLQLVTTPKSSASPWWVVIWLAFAYLSKSTAIGGGLVIVLFAVINRQRSLAIAITILTMFALAIHANVGRETGIAISNMPGYFDMLERASRILSTLMAITFSLMEPRLIYDVYALPNWHWISSMATLTVTALALRRIVRRQATLLEWGIVWMVIPLVVYLQFMPYTTWSMASDRFTLIATFGLALLVVGLGQYAGMLGGVLFVAVLGLNTLSATSRLPFWDSERELFIEEFRINPTHPVAVYHWAMNQVNSVDEMVVLSRVNAITDAGIRALVADLVRFSYQSKKLRSQQSEQRVVICRETLRLLQKISMKEASAHYLRDLTTNSLYRNAKRMVDPGQRASRSCRGG